MKIVLVGRDQAPAGALKKVQEYLASLSNDGNSYKVLDFLGDGQFTKESVGERVLTADVLLVGMSSSADLAEKEICAAETAVRAHTPFGFYADTFGCYKRPWFAKLRDKASFVFVVDKKEAESARELFPNAKVVASGNPMWEDFFTPKLSREEVRERLGVEDGQRMILCPGGKLLAVNMQHFGGVISAAHMLGMNPKDWKIVLAIHPGDGNYDGLYKLEKKKDSDEYEHKRIENIYKDLAEYSKVPVVVVPKSQMPTPHIIPGCDVVVESASTIGIEVVCQRKPVTEFFTETALNRLEETGIGRSYELCEQGVAREVSYNPAELANAILDLVVYDGFREMRKRQEEYYPPPSEKGEAIRKMVATLVEAAS